MFAPLKITFHLDGTGVYFDVAEPLHLDALLTFVAACHHVKNREAPDRGEEPQVIPIPLRKWRSHGTWGWCASALFPDGEQAESVQFWRKKFRLSRVQLADGNASLTNETRREWNMPMPLVLCKTMVAWAYGERRAVLLELREIRCLGKKRSMGKGIVQDVEVERITEDYSMVRDGLAQRWLPDPNGTRLCRPIPPYWNNCGRLRMCEVGDPYAL